MKLVRLCHWTHRQWEPGDPKPYPPWNALAVLDLIRAGKTRGFCAQYAQVFAQACLSFGWQSRYLELGPKEDPCAHFTTEVWVDPLGKWVVLDPFHAVWYERDGRPLSGLEVHQALVAGEAAKVIVRTVPDGSTVDPPRRQALLDAHYYLRFHRKADHLSHPESPFHWQDKVDWADPLTVRWAASEIQNPAVQKGPTAPWIVKRQEEFDFEVNRVAVDVQADRLMGKLTLTLSANMPGLSYYRVRIGNAEPVVLRGDRLEVKWDGMKLRVEILPVNARGAEGVPARVTLK